MNPSEKELATASTIKAVQTPGVVTITAEGNKPSPKYDVALEQSPEAIFPPQFVLTLNPPADIDVMPITLFIATATFGAHEPVKEVVWWMHKARTKCRSSSHSIKSEPSSQFGATSTARSRSGRTETSV